MLYIIYLILFQKATKCATSRRFFIYESNYTSEHLTHKCVENIAGILLPALRSTRGQQNVQHVVLWFGFNKTCKEHYRHSSSYTHVSTWSINYYIIYWQPLNSVRADVISVKIFCALHDLQSQYTITAIEHYRMWWFILILSHHNSASLFFSRISYPSSFRITI